MKKIFAIPLFAFPLFGVLCACSSQPKQDGPAWIHQPTRVVDNGYIVYVGMAHGFSPERAQFKAEGLALEDLANECSLIPKGSRIEDRYLSKSQEEDGHHPEDIAYVKLALEFQECEAAKKAIDPAEIRKVANVSFTEQLKKYQDLSETGEIPQQVAEVQPSDQMAPPPERQAGWDDSTHFFVMRQYVAYQKEVVVLAPPAAYPPNAPVTRTFIAQVQPVSEQIQGIQTRTPAVAKQAWSSLPARPIVNRPASLAPPAARMNSVVPPAGYRQKGFAPRGQPTGGQYRRRHRRDH